jgi:hypothetical protein
MVSSCLPNRVEAIVKRVFRVVLFLGLCLTLMASCGPTDRHYEPEGGFSYVPPVGWKLVDASALAYKVAVGPETDGFATNLTVVDEPFDGSLDEYVSSAMDGLSQYFDSFQVLSQEEFKPEESAPGVRIVAENVQVGRVLRQRFYLFDGGAKKLVVTCTRLADAAEELDAACEGSLKTFRFESE